MSFAEEDSLEREKERAKKRAMYLLGSRDYCRNELYKKLAENYCAETCHYVIELMEHYGFIDDESYARKLAKKLIKVNHRGKKRARFEMTMKGLDPEIVDEALEQYTDEEIIEEIESLILKKYSEKLYDRNDVQKVIAAMARRGYGFDDIKKAITMAREELEEQEEEDNG